ncbi:MAG: Gfo/Idh/MocA family oxidoreductase [Albidovulum sp.]|nr:Gfo/Idh/MocA family oxidoreductase [Albidovulum sp.]
MAARIGVIGTGWWATTTHIPVALANPKAEVVAVADLDSARLDTVCGKFGIQARYTDFRRMLAEQDLDGVVVATPHTEHAKVAIPSLEAGCHAMVEKPMATSGADARAIVDAAAAAGKQVMVPCGWNFSYFTRNAADLVAGGAIGEVRHVVCVMAAALGDLFAGEPMLETADHLFRPPPSTWADPEKAGGFGWGQMSHSLAWVVRVTGLRADSAFCLAAKSPTGVDYFDAAAARMANGATLSLSGASTVPKHCGYQLDIRLYGSEGMLLFDVERERLEVRRNDGADQVVPIAPGDGAYDGTLPMGRFIEICAGESAANESDGENGKIVVEILEAIYRSMSSGRLERVGA